VTAALGLLVLGLIVGDRVLGGEVGRPVTGCLDGFDEGAETTLGVAVDGRREGLAVVGLLVGRVGEAEGAEGYKVVGAREGFDVVGGSVDGKLLGFAVAVWVGTTVLGVVVGSLDGRVEGLRVGALVLPGM
jgi:hypothetical protein